MNFNLYMPTRIFFGKGQIKQLGRSIKQYGNKVLLLYGKGSIKRNGVFQAVVEELTQNGIDYVELSGVDPNPRISTIRTGADICRKEAVDFILAVGGGSTIDCAKGIAAAAKYDGDPWDFYVYKATAQEVLPVGSVLTLSATGSEMNNGSVVTNTETRQKHGWGCDMTFPKFSILDPTYTYSVSKHQTACGVVDTLTHLYEFYFNSGIDAVLTDRISEAVMKTVIEFGPVAFSEPDNYEARANLMWSSSMALNGIAIAGKEFDGFNHLTEHALGAIYDITHADGLSILAPHWMEYILNEDTTKKLAQFGRNVWGINGGSDRDTAREAIKRTKEYYVSLGMPVKLSQVGIDSSRFDDVIERAFFGETLGQFVRLTREDVRRILTNAL